MRFLWLALLLPLSAQAMDKLNCEAAELQSKSCHLTVGKTEIELRTENIVVFAQTQARLFPTPFQSSLSAWDSVEMKSIKNKTILDFVSWDMPGSAGQNLMESISQLIDGKIEPISTRAIQKKSFSPKNSTNEFTSREHAKIAVDENGRISVTY